MLKAAGITAGAMFIAIGLAGQVGGGNLFSSPARAHISTVSKAQAPPAQPSPQASASSQPRPELQSLTVAGSIYAFRASPGGGKKKHKG
jgi:hypothetical protein